MKDDGWLPISEAPKDYTGIFAVAKGVDGRPLFAIVHWGCKKHCFLSSYFPCKEFREQGGPHCEMRWLGSLTECYGVEFTHFQYLPKDPY